MRSPARNVDSKPLAPPGRKCSGSGSGSGSGSLRENPLINKGPEYIFYKTRLCNQKMQGYCSNGEKCNFAHGMEELHEPPPNWKELVNANGKRPLDSYRTGTPICWKFISGKGCPYGEHCYYLHPSPNNIKMARTLPMHLSAPSFETAGPMEQRHDTAQSGINMQLPLNSGGPNESASPANVTEAKFLNLKPPRKIAGIYGDWPDGYSLPDNN